METLISTATSNPVYLGILGVIIIILVYALIKKIIKLVVSFGVLLVMYVFYLNYTDQEIPATVDDLKKSMSGNVEKIKDVASESFDNAKESTKKVLEEKVEEKIEGILSN